MKTAAPLFVMLVLAGWIWANCPPGDVVQPTGDTYCDCTASGCECWPVVECVSACFPYECADRPLKPTKTTKVKKQRSGKLQITRLVVHTEQPLVVRPHVWMIRKNPDTGKPVSVPVPSSTPLTAKLQAKVALLESALAEQIASKCCQSVPPKK